MGEGWEKGFLLIWEDWERGRDGGGGRFSTDVQGEKVAEHLGEVGRKKCGLMVGS